MKKILFSIFVLIEACSIAGGETLSPEQTVRKLIQSVQKHDANGLENWADVEKIASHKRHAMTRERFLQTIKGINASEISFNKRETGGFPQTVTVRMNKPRSYDFELELRKGNIIHQEDHYVVIALHP